MRGGGATQEEEEEGVRGGMEGGRGAPAGHHRGGCDCECMLHGSWAVLWALEGALRRGNWFRPTSFPHRAAPFTRP